MNPENNKKTQCEFSQRLNKALENKVYPNRGRATFLSQTFKITNKATGKWLNGECLPTIEKIIKLSELLDVSTEWLLAGYLDKTQNNSETLNKNGLTLEKIISLQKRINNLSNHELSHDHFNILNGMLDGIDTTISTWLAMKKIE